MGLPVPSALATDLYQLTMMAGYAASGHEATSTFELFVRELPASRRYLMAAGLAQALDYLEGLRFTPDEIAWLRTVPALAAAPVRFFDEVLPAFRFTGDVWAMDEGEIVFPHEPLVRVTAPVMEAQIVETALLAILTFQTSVASKASRVVSAAAGRTVAEFGSRRAHGLEAACLAARAACLAGCAATSNVEAGRLFDLPLTGTMAHSWVMAFDDEIAAFRHYMGLFGEQSTLLIDTLRHREGGREDRGGGPATLGRAPRQRRPREPVASGPRDPGRGRTARDAHPRVRRPGRASRGGARRRSRAD
jgi:nicotinate phosphoribosyltransferase